MKKQDQLKPSTALADFAKLFLLNAINFLTGNNNPEQPKVFGVKFSLREIGRIFFH